MVYLFYTTYISVDLAQHEIFRAKVGKGGIKHKTWCLPGPEVIKLFSCSTQLSMEFQMLIKPRMLKNKRFSCFQQLRCCIYHAHKYQNANNFNLYKHDKCHAKLS